jgi:gluconolactonase
VRDFDRAYALCLALALPGCGSDAATPSASGGSSGTSSSGGTSGQGAGGGGGLAGGGSSNAGSGGGGQGGSLAGGGQGGSVAGTGGTAGGAAPETLWECPPGPFPDPVVGEIEDLCDGFDFAFNYLEGPTWVKAQNALYFSNFDILEGTGGDIVKYTLGGQCELFTTNVGCNGLAVGFDGQLLAACQQTRSVLSFDLSSKVPLTLADMYMGEMLDTPNDLVVHSNGSVYFTNRLAELDGRPVGYGTAVFWIDPAGTLALIETGDGNGIALSPDESTLYVNNLGTWSLDQDGVPGAKGANLVGGDGLAADCAGNLYMSGGQIVNAQGENVGNFPGGTNMAFGGPDGSTLFVVSGGSEVRALHMNIPGIP